MHVGSKSSFVYFCVNFMCLCCCLCLAFVAVLSCCFGSFGNLDWSQASGKEGLGVGQGSWVGFTLLGRRLSSHVEARVSWSC